MKYTAEQPELEQKQEEVIQTKWTRSDYLYRVLREDETLRDYLLKRSPESGYTLKDWCPFQRRSRKEHMLEMVFPQLEKSLKNACIEVLDKVVKEIIEGKVDAEGPLQPDEPSYVPEFYVEEWERFIVANPKIEAHMPSIPEHHCEKDAYIDNLVGWTRRNIPDLPSISTIQAQLDSVSDEVKRDKLGRFYKEQAEGKNLLPFMVDGDGAITLAKHQLPMIPEFHYIRKKDLLQQTESESHFNDQELFDNLKNEDTFTRSHCVVLMSAPDTGKTSLMKRALCSEYGIYITNSTAEDTGNTVDRCSRALHRTVKSMTSIQLRGTVQQTVSCSLLARAVYLNALLDMHSEEHEQEQQTDRTGQCNTIMTPQQFLVAQVGTFTQHMEMIFERLMDLGLQYTKHDYCDGVEELTRLALKRLIERLPMTPRKRFLFCIDDAHRYAMPGVLGGQELYSFNGTPRQDNLLAIQGTQLTNIDRWINLGYSGFDFVFAGTMFEVDTRGTFHIGLLKRKSAGIFQKVITGLSHAVTPQEVIEFLELHVALSNGCRQWIRSVDFSAQYLPMRRGFLGTVLKQVISTAADKSRTERLREAFSMTLQTMAYSVSDRLFDYIMVKDNENVEARESWLQSNAQHLQQLVKHHQNHTNEFYSVQNNEIERMWFDSGLANYQSTATFRQNVLDKVVFDTTEPLTGMAARVTLKRLTDKHPQVAASLESCIVKN